MGTVKDTWLGTVTKEHAGLYFDTACMVIMGGMPWQVYIVLFIVHYWRYISIEF